MIDVLYHYTNIESLALILKNKTFRLNSLNNMDDLEENMTADVKNVGMFTYISSWTDSSRESIALWKQYTNTTTGVRIELPKNPFKKYSVKNMLSPSLLKQMNITDENIKSIIRLDKMLASKYFTQVLTGDDILFKVLYTEDEDKILPKIYSYDAATDSGTLALGEVGKYKRYDWNYQKEWRYIIQFLPENVLTVLTDGGKSFQKVFVDIMNGTAKQPFPYYDLEIADEAFKKMKVVLSPTISPGNEILIRNALDYYNKDATIAESKFKGKMK